MKDGSWAKVGLEVLGSASELGRTRTEVGLVFLGGRDWAGIEVRLDKRFLDN